MAETFDALLVRWREGDREAEEQVASLAYSELRRLAGYFFRQERPGHTLQPTALVNEVFLRLSSGQPVPWQNRAHFFAVAGRQMRRILIDYARRRNAAQRDDAALPVSIIYDDSVPPIEDLLT